MPFIKIYIHFVWTTKNFSPLLNGKTLREKVKSHILENCINKGIHVDQLAVQKEHCHCLISLGKEQTTSKLMQLIKRLHKHYNLHKVPFLYLKDKQQLDQKVDQFF